MKSLKESRENERQEVLEMSCFSHLWSMRLNKGNGKEIELVKETQKGMLKRNRTGGGGGGIETRGIQNSKENARLQNYMLAKEVFFDV